MCFFKVDSGELFCSFGLARFSLFLPPVIFCCCLTHLEMHLRKKVSDGEGTSPISLARDLGGRVRYPQIFCGGCIFFGLLYEISLLEGLWVPFLRHRSHLVPLVFICSMAGFLALQQQSCLLFFVAPSHPRCDSSPLQLRQRRQKQSLTQSLQKPKCWRFVPLLFFPLNGEAVNWAFSLS